MKRKELFISTAVLLLAACLSVNMLSQARRLHPDEAFYLTFARHAAVNGDWWLLAEPVDKPPLTFYLNALSFSLLGVHADAGGVLHLDNQRGEFAGRMPSLLLSVLLVAVVMALAKQIFKNGRSVWLAGLVVALSPLRTAFAATAFTDMPMLLLALLSVWMAARGRPAWCGFWFILSIAAKPQSIFYLPLILSFIMIPFCGRRVLHFLIPVVIGGVLLWGWDALRTVQGGVSIWALGQAHYTPTTLTPLSEYGARFNGLWQTVRYSFGHEAVTLLIVLWLMIRFRLNRWVLWSAAFCALHIILTLNLFDRNLIILLPPLALMTAAAGHHLKGMRGRYALGLSLLLAVVSLNPVSIGGDDGRHNGIDRLARYLNEKPVATVIYDRWLDWELDFYLGQWTNKRRVYYPSPEELTAGALSLNETGTRYFVAPVDVDFERWLDFLRAAGFGVTLDYALPRFVVYALVPPTH